MPYVKEEAFVPPNKRAPKPPKPKLPKKQRLL